MQNKNKIIYSLRINVELQLRGFKPILTMENPKYDGLMCWVYENTEEFSRTLDSLIRGNVND